MHITIGDVKCHITHMGANEQIHWPELYKSFIYELPNANRQYLVQLKLLCTDIIGKNIYSFDQLETECKAVIKKNRWHDELWNWYVKKAVRDDCGSPTEIRQALSDLMTAKGKDSTTALIELNYGFYTGHLTKVIDFCNSKNINISFVDRRHHNTLNAYSKPHNVALRKYQTGAIVQAVNNKLPISGQYQWHWHRGVFQIPTGGGKTEVAIALSQMFNGSTTFIVNRKELLHQTHTRFGLASPGQNIGLIGDGILLYTGVERIVIASAQTLWAMNKQKHNAALQSLIETTGQLIIDEAHGVAAGDADEVNTLVQLAGMFDRAHARWALTATPNMRDDLSNALLKGVTGEVIFKITTQELIKLGYLTPPKIIFTKIKTRGSYEDPITQDELTRPSGSQWASLYDYAIVKNPWRNKAIADIIATITTPAIVLVKRLDHIDYINHYLRNPIPFIKGTSTSQEREAAKAKLRSGEYPILCATTIFDEGVDIPEIRAIIMAGGGKSDIKTMQRLGRGLRISQGKTDVHIYDFIDQCEEAPGWVPAKHSRDRMILFKKEGFDIVQR